MAYEIKILLLFFNEMLMNNFLFLIKFYKREEHNELYEAIFSIEISLVEIKAQILFFKYNFTIVYDRVNKCKEKINIIKIRKLEK